MIESVQHFRLQAEAHLLRDRYRLRDGDIRILCKLVVAPEPVARTHGSRSIVRAKVRWVRAKTRCNVFGIDPVVVLPPLAGHRTEPDGVLKLLVCHPGQIHSADQQIVELLVPARNLERCTRLKGVGSPERPSTHRAVQPCIAVEERFALAERKLIGPDNVDHMVDV